MQTGKSFRVCAETPGSASWTLCVTLLAFVHGVMSINLKMSSKKKRDFAYVN